MDLRDSLLGDDLEGSLDLYYPTVSPRQAIPGLNME